MRRALPKGVTVAAALGVMVVAGIAAGSATAASRSSNADTPNQKGQAVILLRYSVGGKIAFATVDHDGAEPITTKTCKVVLQRSKTELAARFAGHFPNSTFVDASCLAMPGTLGAPLTPIN